jgi:phenol hydroxylase P4 protein
MGVRAIGEYKFESRSRQELYGDDQLVHVLWRNNPMMCAAACFRAPKAMPFGEFVTAMVEPWASSDPDFQPGTTAHWMLESEAIDPKQDESIADLGIGHKAVLSFATVVH